MYSTETELTNDILKLQADVLGEDIDEDHPYLKKNKNASKSKQFITDRKFVIGAINELVSSQEALSGTTEDALATVYGVLGQIALDQTLKERVLEEAPSLIELVLQLSKDFKEMKENPSSGGITNLQEELKKLGMVKYERQEDIFNIEDDGEETHTFTLTKNNIDTDSIKLYINGLYYPNENKSMYIFGTEGNGLTISWALENDPEKGFDLSGSQVIVEYSYEVEDEEEPNNG